MPDAVNADATAQIYEKVFAPVFFHKLAQAGISPRNAEEARSLLRFGEAAYNLDRREAEKRAAARGDAFAKAASLLEAEAGTAYAPASDRDEAAAVKAAADVLLADPTIAAAAALIAES